MKTKNKYINHVHISERKFKEILMYFCADETASKTALYTKVQRKTINRIFTLIRYRIVELAEKDNEQISGDIELDESYFGPKRIRGKEVEEQYIKHQYLDYSKEMESICINSKKLLKSSIITNN